MSARFYVRVTDVHDTIIFAGEIRADDDYLQITHAVNESSRIELRATAGISALLAEQEADT